VCAFLLYVWLGPRAAELEISAELLAALAFWAGSGRTGKRIGHALQLLLERLVRRPSMVGGC
jgi:hypothetical protein